jgi:predicted nucleic acid-binding protein
LASQFQALDDGIIQRAASLESQGLGAIDALHVACAEASGCDYFLTCDDRLVRRYSGQLKVVNPVSFVLEITGETE